MAEQDPQVARSDIADEGVPSRVPIWDLVRYYLGDFRKRPSYVRVGMLR